MKSQTKEIDPMTTNVFQILLALAEEDQHGYRIMQTVQQNSEGKFNIGPGTLYGAIKRLLEDGWIEESGERPDPSLDDERRRYYHLTGRGRQALNSELLRLDTLLKRAKALHLLPTVEANQL